MSLLNDATRNNPSGRLFLSVTAVATHLSARKRAEGDAPQPAVIDAAVANATKIS